MSSQNTLSESTPFLFTLSLTFLIGKVDWLNVEAGSNKRLHLKTLPFKFQI